MKRLIILLCLLAFTAPLFAQESTFDIKFKAAQELYEKGNYQKALEAVNIIPKRIGNDKLTEAQKKQIKDLSSRCTKAIEAARRLDLSASVLDMPFGGSRDSLHFEAAQPDKVAAKSSAPQWCKAQVKGNYVFIETEMNPDKTKARKAEVTVTMTLSKSKVITRKFTVSQAARPNTQKLALIQATPHFAGISVDGGQLSRGVWEGKLDSGPHKIHVERLDYFPKDTVINIVDDMQLEETLNLSFTLKPQFVMLKVDVQPEEGFSFGESAPYSVTINGQTVLNYNYSYDDDRDINYYKVYSDGTIPVPAGQLLIDVTAPSFELEHQELHLQNRSGEVIPLSFALKAKLGWLSLIDAGQARNAMVSIDGKQVGPVWEITRYPLAEGVHMVALDKEGFLPSAPFYTVTVREHEESVFNVSMHRYVSYSFTSNPEDAKVTIDGEYIGNTPTKPYVLRELAPGQSFEVEISKEGYLPMHQTLVPSFEENGTKNLSCFLPKTYKVNVTTDEPDLQLLVKNSRNGDTTYVENAVLPADVYLPLRKKPYYVELHRIGQNAPAYRGHLRVKDERKTKHHIQSWSEMEFVPLSVTMNVYGNAPFQISTDQLQAKEYKVLGGVNLLQFRLFSGLSTAGLRGKAFLASDLKTDFVPVDPATPISVSNYQVLPAITCLFLNGDFRLGGAICDYLDVNLLASYAWYPNFLKKILSFSHVEGHDVFLGAELSTRIPYFNVTLRAGMQMYPNLTANLYNKGGSSSSNTELNYICAPLDIPNAFVVGVTIAIGGKGNPIARIF